MGWRGFVRSMAAASRRAHRAQVAAQRRAERDSMRRRRELVSQMAAMQRAHELQRAQYEVAVYENYLEVLLSVHKEAWRPWNWSAVAASHAPAPPPYEAHHETAARRDLEGYSPSLKDKLLGQTERRVQELQAAVEQARAADAAAHHEALRQHEAAVAYLQWLHGVAGGVLRRDVAAFAAVLDHLSPFEELEELGTAVEVAEVLPDAVRLGCLVRDADIVPREELRLTASGKLTSKAMPTGRYWELYQDHVCSCTLRVAREVFGLLPVSRVLVDVAVERIDTSVGHPRPMTIQSVLFERGTFDRLNLDAIDPSDAMKNFSQRSAFKKSAGFAEVTPLALEEEAPARPKKLRAAR